MALTIAIEGLGVLDTAEATTNWGINGSGGSSFALDNEIYYTQAGSMSSAISSGKWAWLYYNHGSTLNFSTTYAGQMVGIWFQISTQGSSLALNGTRPGVSIRMGTDTGNFREWALGGNDYFANKYTGGWAFALIDPTSAGSGDTGTYSATTVQFMGVQYSGNTSARSNNLFVDSVMVGSGIRITGTETTAGEGWREVVDYCTDRANRAWGFIQEKEPGIFSVFGNLYVGDSAQTAVTSLTDSARVIKFSDFAYYSDKSTPALSSGIPDGFNGLVVEDAASYTTTFQDGVKVGTDSGRSGSVVIGSTDVNTTFDLYGGSNAASVTALYATAAQKITGGITWGDDAQHEMMGGSFSGCGQFDPVGAVVIRNWTFAELADDGTADASRNSALLWNASIDIEDCNFLANSHAGSDIAHGIEYPAAGTFSHVGLNFSGNEADVHFSAGTGNLVINKDGNSNASTSTNDSTGTVTIQGSTTFTLTVSNEQGTLLEGVNVRFEETDGTEISSGATDSSGVYTYADTIGNRTIGVKARKIGYNNPPFGVAVVGDFNIPRTLTRDPAVNRI